SVHVIPPRYGHAHRESFRFVTRHRPAAVGAKVASGSQAVKWSGQSPRRLRVGISSSPRADIIGKRFDEAHEIRLQRAKTGGPRERKLVHVEPPVDLDLQAVPALRRPSV